MDLLRQHAEDTRASRERDDGPLLDVFTVAPRRTWLASEEAGDYYPYFLVLNNDRAARIGTRICARHARGFRARLDAYMPEVGAIVDACPGVVLAGGLVSTLLVRRTPYADSDADLFLVGVRPEDVPALITRMRDVLLAHGAREAHTTLATTCVTINYRNPHGAARQVQLITTINRSVSELLHHFDHGACMFAYADNRVYTTPTLGRVAWAHAITVMQLEHVRWSTLNRTAKYARRGFAVLIPQVDARLAVHAGGRPVDAPSGEHVHAVVGTFHATYRSDAPDAGYDDALPRRRAPANAWQLAFRGLADGRMSRECGAFIADQLGRAAAGQSYDIVMDGVATGADLVDAHYDPRHAASVLRAIVPQTYTMAIRRAARVLQPAEIEALVTYFADVPASAHATRVDEVYAAAPCAAALGERIAALRPAVQLRRANYPHDPFASRRVTAEEMFGSLARRDGPVDGMSRLHRCLGGSGLMDLANASDVEAAERHLRGCPAAAGAGGARDDGHSDGEEAQAQEAALRVQAHERADRGAAQPAGTPPAYPAVAPPHYENLGRESTSDEDA